MDAWRSDVGRENRRAFAGACVPADEKVSYEYNGKWWSVSGKATSSADGCMAVARKALRAAGSDFAQAVEQPQKGQPVRMAFGDATALLLHFQF